MNKELQRNINDWCLTAYGDAAEEFKRDAYKYDCKRLRTCSAWVYETEHFYILRSYNTFYVAIIRKENAQCYDLLRYVYGYTSTSAQHIAKFCSDYGDRRISNYTYR